MYFLNRFLICFCSLFVCSGHTNHCSNGHMQKGKIQNLLRSFNFSLKVILSFTAIHGDAFRAINRGNEASKEKKTHSNSTRKSSLTLVSLRFRASVVMFYQKTNLLTVTNHYSLPTSGVKVVGSFSSTFLSLNKQVYCSVLSWQFKQPVKVQVKQFAKRKSRFFYRPISPICYFI